MGKKAKRKRSIKSAEQEDICLTADVSTKVKVEKNATKSVVKEEVHAEINTVAGAAENKNQERKQSVMKRKRATSTDDAGSVESQVDSQLHDTLPPRKRRPGVKSRQNDEPLQQEKDTRQSISKRQRLVKKQCVTRRRKSASEAEKKKPDEEQLEAVVVVTDGKKNTKVKCEFELPPVASPDKAVDKKAVDIEKCNVPCSALHSRRKFIGAHVSIVGMFATYFLVSVVDVVHFYAL